MKYYFEILQQVNTFMEAIDDLHRLLQQIIKVCMDALEAQASSVFLYDPDRKILSFEVALGEKGDILQQCNVHLGEGIVGYAAKNLEVVNIQDVRQDSRFDSSWDQMTGFTTHSILAVPMVRRGELVGVLEVINKKGNTGFDKDDQNLFGMIASQAAIAVENAKLYQAKLEKNRHLEEALSELRDTQSKLIEAEKMSTIGNMSGQIMHDIRNPMSIIHMCCEILNNPDIKDKNVPELVKVIKLQVDRSVNMIRDFLDFARGQTSLDLKLQPLDRLIDEIAEYQENDCISKGITFHAELEENVDVLMDGDKIHRVINNLINNAKESIIEKGTGRHGVIRLNVVPKKEHVEFVVIDNGPGISLDIRPKIFQPFVTHGKKNGTGLGLAIVEKIVKDHGGQITFESCCESEIENRESGTKFFISIPFNN